MADEMGGEMKPLPDELKQFESVLRGCAPATPQIERDRLMYLAGRASLGSAAVESATEELNAFPLTLPSPTRGEGVQSATGAASYKHTAWLKSAAWPLATAALVLLSLTLGAALFSRSPEVRVVYVEKPAEESAVFAWLPEAETSPAATTDSQSYLQMRNLVLARGVEALPESATSVSSRRADEIPISPLLRRNF